MSDFQSAEEICQVVHCHSVTARLLFQRGFRTRDSVDLLLKPELKSLPDPFLIHQMDKAVARFCEALEKKSSVVIYGDYDVDGTCGSAVLSEFFHSVGFENFKVYQPNRFTEGYGINTAAVEKLIDAGAELLISVDCGITALEPIQIAKNKNVDVIVIDHHKVGDTLPAAHAIVNPQKKEDESGLKNLCGAALAFFFCIAVRAKLRSAGYFATRQEPNMLALMDLVAVATVADMMELKGVNRILVKHGLQILKTKPRPGLKAILDQAGVTQPTAMTCGFLLGPRINAAGRLKSAKSALDMLLAKNYEDAQGFAAELEKLNSERRQTQDAVFESARLQAKEQIASVLWEEERKRLPAAIAGPWPRALVLYSPEWHEGVVGIVASKLTEEFKRPVIVLAQKEGSAGVFKGSMRSFAGFDFFSAISNANVYSHLIAFGGHAFAGGVTVAENKILDFQKSLNELMALTTDKQTFTKAVYTDGEIGAEEIDHTLLQELESLAPYGYGFPEPVFEISNSKIEMLQILKEKHLKFKVTAKPGKKLDAIYFNALASEQLSGDALTRLRTGEAFPRLWISPQWNEWKGVKNIQLRITHLSV